MTEGQGWEAGARALWAKAGDPPHSLLGHLLDTAAVALTVLAREPKRTRALYAEDWGLSEEEALRFVAFLVALHDLGKATADFQGKWPEGAARVRAAGLSWEESLFQCTKPVPHGAYTEILLSTFFSQRLACKWAVDVGKALGAHHGFQAGPEDLIQAEDRLGLESEGWREARAWLVEQVAQALGVRSLPEGRCKPEGLLRLMALASFADWIASDPRFFSYGRDPLALGYWRDAQQRAESALDLIGWRVLSPRRPPSFDKLFPFPPNPLQAAVPEVLAGIREPVFLLVEAPMGVGKTEAALYAYLLLQSQLDHRGLYVALPTQATANGVFPRVRAFLERLDAGMPLDLQLQHGTSILNPEYRRLREKARLAEVYDEAEGVEGGVMASAWFSARKLAMLSRHGVGTVDQALLGVLKVKHHFVRLWGLMNRVVVLDEVHAYDTYTSGLIAALLRWLRALGSSVVLMTATLPRQKREELLRAWGALAPHLPPYPRVAVFSGGNLVGAKTLPLVEKRRLRVSEAPVDVETLAKLLKDRLPGALGVIVNTVDRAQALYQALGAGERLTLGGLLDIFGEVSNEGAWRDLRESRKEKADAVVGKRLGDGTLVFLLHARFPAEERALREAVALALFGKEGPRPGKAILVATQVAEQSLDLDFDLLYSDLAPVDLLLQRAGRLHRHPRSRPKVHAEPVLLVGGLGPQPPDFGAPLYWNRVYEEYVLLSTWLSLRERKVLEIPSDIESLLEEVYTRNPEDFQSVWRDQAEASYKGWKNRWEREQETARNLALDSVEDLLAQTTSAAFAEVLRLDDDAEDARTQRFLTRLGEPSVPVVLVYVREGVWFLDAAGEHPVKLKGELSEEEVLRIWGRVVRLSRPPIPQELREEVPPPSWRGTSLLRGLRVLEVGRVFRHEGGAFRVEVNPELGVVYSAVK